MSEKSLCTSEEFQTAGKQVSETQLTCHELVYIIQTVGKRGYNEDCFVRNLKREDEL